ncbi:MAG: hypothetical protein ACLFR0_05320 [Alphaproteobacteria bacterium]
MRYTKGMRHLLVLLAMLMIGFPAYAQDSALPGTPERERSIDEQLGITKQEERRKSGDPKKDFALKFYDNCLKTAHPMMTERARDLLCSCTAREMEDGMELEELNALFNDKDKAPDIYRAIMQTHYAHCSRHAVRETTYDLCINMEALKKTKKDWQVCECTADTYARYMTANSKRLMTQMITRDKNALDPLGQYMESGSYQGLFRNFLDRCIEIHVWGYR